MCRCYHKVFCALVKLHLAVVHLPNASTPPSDHIIGNSKFESYFSNCLRAFDGTHVNMHLSAIDQTWYQNRKQKFFQNVLTVCNFEMEFTYILLGWEESAHDVRVLHNAQFNHGFVTPSHWYQLRDAGHANSEYVLVPYCGTQYQFKEQQRAGLKWVIPISKECNINLISMLDLK